MNSRRGMTMIELTLVLAMAAILLGVTAAYALPRLARESLRSATYDVQTALQITRIEAVGRNRGCQMIVNKRTREFTVVDTKGTAINTDDEVLHSFELPDTVSFAHPSSGAVVTLPQAGPNKHRAAYLADGTVFAGGDIHLFGGAEFSKISLYAAGGVEVTRWNGSKWVPN